MVSFTPRPLYHGEKGPRYPLHGPPEPVWTTWRRENSLFYRYMNSDPSVVQIVASRYTDYAIAAPKRFMYRVHIYTVLRSLGLSFSSGTILSPV
jgi:hypothetical protein